MQDGRTWNKFVLSDGFMFRANKLCILASSVLLLLLQEAHEGGLMGHFGVKKTEDILAAHFFWPKMRQYVLIWGGPIFSSVSCVMPLITGDAVFAVMSVTPRDRYYADLRVPAKSA